jgi:Fe-S-cluster containining protein
MRPRAKKSLDDPHLIQIVDIALADATRRSGAWLVCKPGCTDCCHGIFAINQLDAERLRLGMAELEDRDPACATRIRARATKSIARIAPGFPGDLKTGVLDETEEAERQFEGLGNDEPCPVLDPESGLCDLYSSRPMTCRVFGPPVRSGEEGGLGVCELCYHGATDEQIASCEMVPDPENIEAEVLADVEQRTGLHGNTIVAFCVR